MFFSTNIPPRRDGVVGQRHSVPTGQKFRCAHEFFDRFGVRSQNKTDIASRRDAVIGRCFFLPTFRPNGTELWGNGIAFRRGCGARA